MLVQVPFGHWPLASGAAPPSQNAGSVNVGHPSVPGDDPSAQKPGAMVVGHPSVPGDDPSAQKPGADGSRTSICTW